VSAPTKKPASATSTADKKAPTQRPVAAQSSGSGSNTNSGNKNGPAPTRKPVDATSTADKKAPTRKPVTNNANKNGPAPTRKPVSATSNADKKAPTRKPVAAQSSANGNNGNGNNANKNNGNNANKNNGSGNGNNANANKNNASGNNANKNNANSNSANKNTNTANSNSGTGQRDSAFRDRIVDQVSQAETPVQDSAAAGGTRRLVSLDAQELAGQCRSAFAYCRGKATKTVPASSPLCLSPGHDEGWSNLIATEHAMECTLYVGASECDVTNAEAIGVLFVDANRAEVVFEVDEDSEWVLSQLHVYVGSDKAPLARDGSPVSPVDYPRVEVFEDPTKTATVELDDGDLQVGHYVIAHASVCTEESFDELATE
jgi:hypothetical protein